jgi:transposase-like protein
MDIISQPYFNNDDAARLMVEGVRWPNGPVCHHCGETERRYPTKRDGRFRCGNPDCRQDYTVTTGTVMESSHIKLHKWLLAFYLVSSSKKGVSAHQLHRSLGLTYKSARFMAHRVRHAMKTGGLTEPMGGAGQIVEADETYYGKVDSPRPRSRGRIPTPTKKGRSGPADKRAIVALVERGGLVRTFHPAVADGASVGIVAENVAKESRLHTDESRLYIKAGREFARHESVKYSMKEYVRGDVHTNSAEGYFSIFKRGMTGIYQHCAEKDLHRYLAEYDFRYNYRMRLGFNDMDRTIAAIRGAEGKRLTYRQADSTSLPV